MSTLAKDKVALYSIDATSSLFTVQAFASGLVSVVAHSPKFAIRDFFGNASFSANLAEDSALDVTIRLTSLDILDEVRNNERREIEKVMFDEVLETNRYSSAQFQSTRTTATKAMENVYRMNIFGELSLHGVRRSTKIESQVMVGDETLKAQGSFSLMQSDFDLKIASVAGGSLKLKDELKFSYFISARRQR
jgi:polyisoprenoid-binding protein YceI